MKTKVLFSCILLSVLLVSCHSEPQPIKVTGITLNSSSLSLIEGETADLTATISPKDADNKAVIWSSSNGSVASVSNGRVSALSPGSTTITAKSDDGGFTATCAVSVAPRIIAVTSITLSKTELTLVEGESETIMATVQPDNATDKTVTWSSSDPTIATVDGGKVIALKMGEAVVRVNTSNGIEAVCKVIVTPRSYSDLSETGTANCYIIPSKGAYKFKADVKGSSSVSIGSPSSAEVLWESFGTNNSPNTGDVISNVNYKDGYVSFISGKNGNAVIAVKNAGGVILWSWHIWVCEGYNPDEKGMVYKNNAGTMMDRNLGALSSEKGSVLSLGLLYQFGRKDPFLSSSATKKADVAMNTGTWPSPVFDSPVLETDPVVTGDVTQYQVEHPMTFIRFRSSMVTPGSIWTVTKNENDPCPLGWKVPDDVWSKALGSDESIMYSGLWDGDKYGLDGLSLFGVSTWYPAGSFIKAGTGQLTLVDSLAGANGFYWGVNSVFAFYQSYDGYIIPNRKKFFSEGNAFYVRCIKE